MAEPRRAKRVKLWSPGGSLSFCGRKEIVIDQGRRLECFRSWPELEDYLCSERYAEGAFERVELYFPNVFTSNWRPWCREKSSTVTMQYLQHSTHSVEKDMIWDGEKATFKGNPKLASLYCIQQKRNIIFRSMTWRREGHSLRQLNITPCNACSPGGHYCSGGCCAVPLSEFSAVENPYVKLSCMTCKQHATSLADMRTCNGRECYTVEKALPGSYVWFGIPKMSGPPNAMLSERDFQRYWTRESVYGVHSFVVDIHTMISAYRQQIANGRPVVLRCGGTLLYTFEVCYVVIVTHEGDGVHGNLPPVNSPLAAGDRSSRCNWSRLLDQNGHCTQKGYPQFMPHHVQVDTNFIWDHVVFAFHLPNGATLSIPRRDLIGGGPLHTDQHTRCHKFRRTGDKSVELCAKAESRYQSHIQRNHLAGVSINELFSSFDEADSSSDDALQSSSVAESCSHLTGDVAESVRCGSQVFVDMPNVSVEEKFSSFEDVEDELPSSPETETHSHLTREGMKHAQDATQEPVVDVMANISVEELFSSFEESSATESQQHSSSLEESSSPCQQSLPGHGGAHTLATANTAQRVEPIAHSSPRLTRQRRYHVQYSLGDLKCALDNVDSASCHGNMPNGNMPNGTNTRNVENGSDTSR